MYRPAAPTWKISKRTQPEIREIHRTLPVMLRFLLGESYVDGLGQGHARLASRGQIGSAKNAARAATSGDMTVKFSSRFFSNLTFAISSIALLLFGFCGTVMAATDPSGSTALPSITVQAPRQVTKPRVPVHRAVGRGSGHRHTVSHERPPATAVQPGGQGSVMERLKRLERESGSCVGGCQSSFPKGNQPWVGCSASAWPMPSVGCRNPRNFTTYVACTETSYFLAWKPMEAWWYCSALALNK
jgi:hypothetical protein